MPMAARGQRIGLLGGSFDPPHAGHLHISREALKRFRLDAVWWLVSPGNPLKSEGPADLPLRMAAARDLVHDPRIVVTDLEARLGTRFTAETLEALFHHYRGVRFAWLMGADNLASFHRWDRWQWIMSNVPIGVIARPGDRMGARHSPAAAKFDRARLPAARAGLLAVMAAPCWCFLNVPMVKMSSTEIRSQGGWVR
nr:nicotinate-nucleotide adenylyltransferase [Anianabacter salinae]